MRVSANIRCFTFTASWIFFSLIAFPLGQARAGHNQTCAGDPDHNPPIPGLDCLQPSEQKCVNTINKEYWRVARAQGRQILKCIEGAVRGRLTTSVEECVAADGKSRVAKKQARLLAQEARRCTQPPSFGYTSGALANQVAVELAFVHSIFGPDLNTPIVPLQFSFQTSCQVEALTLALRCWNEKLKAFNKCKKKAITLRHRPGIEDADSLTEACLTQKVLATRLGTELANYPCGAPFFWKMERACPLPATDLAAIFPGDCSDAVNIYELVRCLRNLLDCNVCLELNAVDGLTRDCDLLDDDEANGSCF